MFLKPNKLFFIILVHCLFTIKGMELSNSYAEKYDTEKNAANGMDRILQLAKTVPSENKAFALLKSSPKIIINDSNAYMSLMNLENCDLFDKIIVSLLHLLSKHYGEYKEHNALNRYDFIAISLIGKINDIKNQNSYIPNDQPEDHNFKVEKIITLVIKYLKFLFENNKIKDDDFKSIAVVWIGFIESALFNKNLFLLNKKIAGINKIIIQLFSHSNSQDILLHKSILLMLIDHNNHVYAGHYMGFIKVEESLKLLAKNYHSFKENKMIDKYNSMANYLISLVYKILNDQTFFIIEEGKDNTKLKDISNLINFIGARNFNDLLDKKDRDPISNLTYQQWKNLDKNPENKKDEPFKLTHFR